jgi:cytochrome c oxidase subunit 4
VKLYVTIFVALLALTAVTVAASFIHLGRWHVPVAIGIAAFKALLVLLFFMHLLGGSRLQWLVVAAAGCFATIFVSLVGADYASRNWYLPTPAPLEIREWQPAELPPASKGTATPSAIPEATRDAAAPAETVPPESKP